jgi:hypothetical protein
MTREDLKNKTLEEIIKQINEENQDGVMTKEEIISLIEKANENGQDNFAKFLKDTLLKYPEINFFIYSEYEGTMYEPRPVSDKADLICFLDISLEECINENGHCWEETSACAESGTSEMVCKHCGFTHTISF